MYNTSLFLSTAVTWGYFRMIKARRHKHRVFAGVLVVLLTSLTTSVYAQSYDNPGLGQQPVAAHPQDYKPLGIRAGTFMLHPGDPMPGFELPDTSSRDEGTTLAFTAWTHAN